MSQVLTKSWHHTLKKLLLVCKKKKKEENLWNVSACVSVCGKQCVMSLKHDWPPVITGRDFIRIGWAIKKETVTIHECWLLVVPACQTATRNLHSDLFLVIDTVRVTLSSSVNTCFSLFLSKIVRQDRTMEEIVFPVPNICEFLTSESKLRVYYTTERDEQGSKINDFFLRAEDLFNEMNWQKKLRGESELHNLMTLYGRRFQFPVSIKKTMSTTQSVYCKTKSSKHTRIQLLTNPH